MTMRIKRGSRKGIKMILKNGDSSKDFIIYKFLALGMFKGARHR